ncbi:Degenerin unc-8, partial [Stegodyphus mimosarum]
MQSPDNVNRNSTTITSGGKKYISSFRLPSAIKEKYLYKEDRFMNFYAKMDTESRKRYGYMLQELIKKCSFNSVLCNETDFTFFQNMQYGNCYTFNRKEDGKELKKVSRIGPQSALELELNVMVDSYLDVTQTVGARVVIHNPEEDPNPEEDGVNISPGFESHISLLKTSIHRLPAPYRDRCGNYMKKKDLNGSTKSHLDCTRKCILDLSLNICSCVNPFIRIPAFDKGCDFKNSTQMSCLNHVADAMHRKELICHCPVPCTTTAYSVDVGSSPWIRDSSIRSQLNVLENGEKWTLELYNVNQNKTNIKYAHVVSHAKVEVFYRSLDHTIY